MIFLETKRLVIRNLGVKDADIMLDYRNNEICAEYQREQTKYYNSIVALIKQYKESEISLSAPFMLAVALKDSNEMIGEIVVMPKYGTISLGCTFSYKHHRKNMPLKP